MNDPLLDDKDDTSNFPSWVREPLESRSVADVSWADDDYNENNARNQALSGGDEEELPRIILVMRLTNIVASLLIIGSSTIFIMQSTSTFALSDWVLACYTACFGLLVCCLETQLKFLQTAIVQNFGFFFSPTLRFLFYILMAMIAWTYNTIYGQVTAIFLVTVTLFNTWVLFRYPAFSTIRDRILDEEYQKIEGTFNKERKKQAVRHWADPIFEHA